MKYIGTVLEESVCIRQVPSLSGNVVKILAKNDVIELVDKKDNWYKYKDIGWICSKLDNGTKLLKIEVINKSSRTSAVDGGGGSGTDKNKDKEEPKRYFKDYIDENSYESGTNYSSFIKNMRGIHGMPYQFLPLTDRRLNVADTKNNKKYTSSNFGRKYTEKIITRMPLLLLTPGVPEFLGGYSKSDKNDLLTYLKNRGRGNDESIIDELIGEDSNKTGKFYSFKFAYKEYYKYVNLMLRNMSRFLNIHDKKINGTRLDNYSWEKYTNEAFKGFVSNAESIAFYIDSDTQVSESFTNETTQSGLSNRVNGLSDMSREIQFMLGSTAGVEFEKSKAENYDATLEEFTNFANKYTSILPSSIIDKLTNGVLTVSSGGKMIFPEIWADSSFSRSYDINIKLTTPEADNFSWFMNIGVPMIHLIALVAPRQLGANSYQAPFLVRGYYKGFFNCDMGIITSMNIKRGDKGKWTTNGLPTVVDIDFNLKDLYQIMSISREDKIADLLKNTALLDYIANMCGINVNKPDVLRTLDIYYKYIENKVIDTVTFNGFLGVEQALSNAANTIFNKFRN